MSLVLVFSCFSPPFQYDLNMYISKAFDQFFQSILLFYFKFDPMDLSSYKWKVQAILSLLLYDNPYKTLFQLDTLYLFYLFIGLRIFFMSFVYQDPSTPEQADTQDHSMVYLYGYHIKTLCELIMELFMGFRSLFFIAALQLQILNLLIFYNFLILNRSYQFNLSLFYINSYN